MNKKEIIRISGRLWQYAVQGFAGYVGMILSLLSSLLIIYNFLVAKYIPTSPILFILLAIGLSLFSLWLGYAAKKYGFWDASNELAVEVNPYLSKILGKKDQLGWEQNLINTNLSIESMKVQITFYKKEGINTKSLEEQLQKLVDFKKNIEDMLNSSEIQNGNAKERDEKVRFIDWSRDSMLETQLLYTRLKPNSILLDMGASIADTTIRFAQNSNIATVYGFEAIPYTYNEGLRNIARQPMSIRQKIKYYNIAIGKEDKILKMKFGANENSGNTVFAHLADFSLRKTVEVAQKSILSLIKDFPPHSNLILKIDIEGSEYEAIKPELDLLNVYMIQIETHLINIKDVKKGETIQASSPDSEDLKMFQVFIDKGFKLVSTTGGNNLFVNEANYYG